MRKILVSATAGAVLFTGTLALVGSAAQAQDSGEPTAQGRPQKPDDGSQRTRRHRLIRAVIQTSADTIGIDSHALVAQLRAGKSIAQVATEHQKDPQTVIDALVAKASARIDQAVAEGKLTAEKAATIKEKLPSVAERIVNKVFDGARNPTR
jgi:hypothetical protein